VPDMLSASDVSCLSSAAEGVPVSILEAMAVGKPVVASDVGGVAEAVVAEKTGLLVRRAIRQHSPSRSSSSLRIPRSPAGSGRQGDGDTARSSASNR
jgi:glycogen synthase